VSYMSESVTGEKRRRAYKVEARNPAVGNKTIVFHEEDLTDLSDGRRINAPVGSISKEFIDPSATFEIVDPATDLPTGQTATHGQVYVFLHSLYLACAAERDASGIPDPASEV